MNKYELVYVLSTTQGDEAVAAASEKVQALVASKGTVTNVEEWGRRKLAYEIRDEKEGFYVVVNFEAAADAPYEIDRILKINEEVLRYLLIRKDN